MPIQKVGSNRMEKKSIFDTSVVIQELLVFNRGCKFVLVFVVLFVIILVGSRQENRFQSAHQPWIYERGWRHCLGYSWRNRRVLQWYAVFDLFFDEMILV